MRVKKSIRNIIFSLYSNLFSSLLGFISRTVFIYVLGSTYLGISGLLQNIFGLLAISELGLSTAIGFSLYKPLANNNTILVSAIMSLYKRAYRIIGLIILIMGILLYPHLNFFVDVEQLPSEIVYIYFLYLINIVSGYFLSYKQVLIISDQSAYKIIPLQLKINILTVFIQIIFLLIYKSYLGYLVIQILSSILCNYLQNRYISKQYKDINFNSKDKLPKEEYVLLKRTLVGLMATKVGDFCINSTDNLIISKYVSLVSVGLYSNYMLLRDLINGYIRVLFSNVTSSFGNLIAEENKKRSLEVFNILFFIAFIIYSFEAVALMCLLNPFIEIWIGKDYILSSNIVFVIVLNNFLTGLRVPIITIKNAAGIYLEDIWVPFIFSLINLVISIVLAPKLGIFGVVVGSIIASLLTADWYRPVVVYRIIFKVSVVDYFKRYLVYIILGLIYIISCILICNLFTIENLYMTIFIRFIICIIVPNLINFLLFFNTREFKEIKNIVKTLYK